jgi:hypothetical protein
MTTNVQLTQASSQWATRPSDERFVNLNDLYARVARQHSLSRETLWDAVTAVTAHARSIGHQDTRVAMERIGGKLLDLVAA